MQVNPLSQGILERNLSLEGRSSVIISRQTNTRCKANIFILELAPLDVC